MRHFMKVVFLIFFSLFFVKTNSQIKIYEFSFCGRDQKVEIIEKKNKKFSGLIISKFHKYKKGREIIKKKRIKSETAKKIIKGVVNMEVYKMKDSDDKIDCGDFYLDGDSFSLKISEGKQTFQKTYDEIYPESETRSIEQNPCRRKAQILATLIDRELNLKALHSNQHRKLGYRTCYWTGISQVCIMNNKK